MFCFSALVNSNFTYFYPNSLFSFAPLPHLTKKTIHGKSHERNTAFVLIVHKMNNLPIKIWKRIIIIQKAIYIWIFFFLLACQFKRRSRVNINKLLWICLIILLYSYFPFHLCQETHQMAKAAIMGNTFHLALLKNKVAQHIT